MIESGDRAQANLLICILAHLHIDYPGADMDLTGWGWVCKHAGFCKSTR